MGAKCLHILHHSLRSLLPSFQDHIGQFEHNLEFLGYFDSADSEFQDWQVTVCLYSALHLMNAHLAQSAHHFRSHGGVEAFINPSGKWASRRIDQTTFNAYKTLQNLSRISRYLANLSDPSNSSSSRIRPRHVRKAILNLSVVIAHFSALYQLTPKVTKEHCSEFSRTETIPYLRLCGPLEAYHGNLFLSVG